jgi:putative ABC transport system ATP-binding protein
MLLVEKLVLPNQRIVSLELNKHQGVILLGPNGSGKTLFLRALAALYPVKSEAFTFQGRDISEWRIEEYRSRILYLGSSPYLHGCETLKDFLQLPLKLTIYQQYQSSFDPIPYIQKWKLDHQSLGHLSSGQKQMLNFLRALTLKANILLLDEPCSNLDPLMLIEFEKLLQDWMDKTDGSYLLVTHHQQQIERLNKEVIRFD